jgi:hypothetical protein
MANLGIESEGRSEITALPSSTETIRTGAVAFALQFGLQGVDVRVIKC